MPDKEQEKKNQRNQYMLLFSSFEYQWLGHTDLSITGFILFTFNTTGFSKDCIEWPLVWENFWYSAKNVTTSELTEMIMMPIYRWFKLYWLISLFHKVIWQRLSLKTKHKLKWSSCFNKKEQELLKLDTFIHHLKIERLPFECCRQVFHGDDQAELQDRNTFMRSEESKEIN